MIHVGDLVLQTADDRRLQNAMIVLRAEMRQSRVSDNLVDALYRLADKKGSGVAARAAEKLVTRYESPA